MAELPEKFLMSVSGFSFGKKIFRQDTEGKTASWLLLAGLEGIGPQKYVSGSFFLSFFPSVSLFILSTFFAPILQSIALLFISFGLSFCVLYFLPFLLAKRRMAQAQSELPFLLRELAIYLDIGLPFEKCLEKISLRGYYLSPEFSLACREISSGSSVEVALASLSRRLDFLSAKRSLLLLSSIYETGKGTDSLKRLSEELSASQLSSMRETSSKLSLLSIVFIACSALIPAFFTVFVAVLPTLGGLQLEQWQLIFAFVVAFPILSSLSLLSMFLLLPPLPSQMAPNLGNYLASKGFGYGAQAFGMLCIIAAFALSAFFFALGSSPIALLCLCIAPAAYSLASFSASREGQEAEAHLPDAIYSAASTHSILSAEKMLSFLSKGGFGHLSESFAVALRRMKAGDSFQHAMLAASDHCGSQLASRAFHLITVSYETGGDMYFALREAASDTVSFFALMRERSSQLSLQRYTILAASCALVPFILGTVASLALLLPPGGGQQPNPLSILNEACMAYLLINSLFCSCLIALSEGKPSKAALYFSLVAPLSQLCFIASSTGLSMAFFA